jgi:hypothetical protein
MFPVNQRFCPIFTNAFFWTGQVLEALKEKRTLPSNSQLADMAVPEPSWGWAGGTLSYSWWNGCFLCSIFFIWNQFWLVDLSSWIFTGPRMLGSPNDWNMQDLERFWPHTMARYGYTMIYLYIHIFNIIIITIKSHQYYWSYLYNNHQ